LVSCHGFQGPNGFYVRPVSADGKIDTKLCGMKVDAALTRQGCMSNLVVENTRNVSLLKTLSIFGKALLGLPCDAAKISMRRRREALVLPRPLAD
jgi:hypothetical protein